MGSSLISLILQFILEVFVVLCRLNTNKITKMRRRNVKGGSKMSWVVPEAPDPRKFANTSSYMLTKPAKTASKRATKMPKMPLDNLQKVLDLN
jgi:hypothetical protein